MKKHFDRLPHIAGLIGQYDKSELLAKVQMWPKEGTDVQHAELGGAVWEYRFHAEQDSSREGIMDLELKVRLIRGEARQTAIGLKLDFSEWSREHYVLIPGAVYNGNRFEARDLPYPPIYQNEADLRADMPTIVTAHIPRLNKGAGISRLEQTTWDAAVPAAGVYDPVSGTGYWMLTSQNNPWGPTGITVEENEERTEASILFTAPAIRSDAGKGDRAPDWTEGDQGSLHVRMYTFPCPSLQSLFDRFMHIRCDLMEPPVLRHELPFSAAWQIQEQKFNRSNWEPERGYYSVGLRDNHFQDWQLGWVGGGMSSFPLLAEGQEESRERALSTLEFIFTTQAASGFFHGMFHQGEYVGDGFDRQDSERWHLLRKSADALYFLMKHVILLQRRDAGWILPEHWKQGILKLADAFTGLWNRYGQLGQFVDIYTGEIIVGGSISSAIAPAGLVLAGQCFGRDDYIRAAMEIADHYAEAGLRTGVTTGGPGEILQCPDSESAFGLLESFVVLYETTGEARWLRLAEEMAHQCATWCVPYDFAWPAGSMFGKQGIRTAGSVLANAQNKHGAPGICTLSGDSLFKLYRATGNTLYLKLIQEMAHNMTQYMSRDDKPLRSWDGELVPAGWINERVNMSDWEGKDKVGGIFYGSCWAEVSNMLAYVEIPGLYIQSDTGQVCIFDHVEGWWSEEDGKAGGENHHEVLDGCKPRTFIIHNPTAYDAEVKILIEDSREMKKALGQAAILDCPRLHVPAGDSRAVFLPDWIRGRSPAVDGTQHA